MRTLIYGVFLILCLGMNLKAQHFEAFLTKLYAAPADRRQFMADSFLTTVSTTPLVEGDSVCHFLYKKQAQAVYIAGDHNNWSGNRSPMTRIPNTDLWFRTEVFAPTARIDYKIVDDDAWLLDPRNPLTISGGYGPNSELRMTQYQEALETVNQPGTPRGRLVDTTITSTELGNQRQISIYLPADYDTGQRNYPLVLVHDGPDYIRLAAMPTILDNLIAKRQIPSVIAVFVPAVQRTEEYAGVSIDAFTRFIVQELLPVIDARYHTRRDPHGRAMLGSSNGGNIALYIAMKHPEVFANVAAQSSNIIPEIADRFNQLPKLPLRLYLDLGVYDIPVLLPMVRNFVAQLQQAKYDYLYQEFFEGHSWGSWRAHIDDALTYFFAYLLHTHSGEYPAVPEAIEIESVWPNPASSQLNVSVRSKPQTFISAALYDVFGREMLTLIEGVSHNGVQSFHANTSSLPRGIYHLRVNTGTLSHVRTVLLR